MYLFKRGKKIKDAINSKDEEYDYTELAYWRKANQIHDWFIRNLDLPDTFNCEYAKVEKEDLEALILDCKSVLENHDLAEEYLPTSAGFFFGSTYYDEDYFAKLQNTIEQLNEAILEVDWDNDEIFYSCWW